MRRTCSAMLVQLREQGRVQQDPRGAFAFDRVFHENGHLARWLQTSTHTQRPIRASQELKEESMKSPLSVRLFSTMLTLGVVAVPMSAWAGLCTGTDAAKITCLNEKLKYVEVTTDAAGKPLVRVRGANVQITAGSTGDHTGNLILGSTHTWTMAEEGFVAGYRNTISGKQCTVTGGSNNIASGQNSSVSGGYDNEAAGSGSWVGAGAYNVASGMYSSISGGLSCEASGHASSVSGGYNNEASGYGSSVSAGDANIASGEYSSVSGGNSNEANFYYSSVSGGKDNVSNYMVATICGGRNNVASGMYSTISGGYNRVVTGTYDWRGGGLFEDQ